MLISGLPREERRAGAALEQDLGQRTLLGAGALASAPETDRYCVVVSGAWWVASGDKFNADDTVPAPAGTFVRRVARTPHYDGVKANGTEPAVIAICGMGPITFHPTEPWPDWRKM